jgi:Lysyl oxidase
MIMARSSRWRTRAVAMTIAALTVVPLVATPATHAAEPGVASLRLFSGADEATLFKYGRRIPLYLPIWIEAIGGDFEVRVSRPDYDTPIQAAQVDPLTGATTRVIPMDAIQDWFGFRDFMTATFRTSDGTEVASTTMSFCPNSYSRQRVTDEGPDTPRYPWSCGGAPFTRGMVWGIEEHWAVNASSFEYGGGSVRDVDPGVYDVTFAIKPEFAELFGVAAEDTSATMSVTVKERRRRRHGPHPIGQREPAQMVAAGAVPTVLTPDPSTLPDLTAHPPWSIGMVSRARTGTDILQFAATEWNLGPAQLVVEGFRNRGEDVMETFQYFYNADGDPVGRAPVGTMEFHRGGGHNHWHFLQFVAYKLLTADGEEIVRSKKQSFCIVPTDAVDLTVEGADWLTEPRSLSSSCGSEESIWIREAMPVGWGDTYYQGLGGQGFNVTDLPNGWYQMSVEVNPLGALYETDTTNNVQTRMLHIGGVPGNRNVVVVPWHGIDA